MDELLQKVEAAIAGIDAGTAKKSETRALLSDIRRYLKRDAASGTGQHEAQVRQAVEALSYSERQAVLTIIDEVPEAGGTVVASRIADRHCITRSVIVNAVRKLESAGLIHSRSLGMKGTHIKPLIPNLGLQLKRFVA